MEAERPWWKRKKVLAAFFGCMAIIASEFMGIPKETVFTIGGVVSSFLIGQGVADFGKEIPEEKKPE